MIPHHRVKKNGKCDLWDLGPQVPPLPDEPKEPDSKLKGDALIDAQIDHEAALEAHKAAVSAYATAKRDRVMWIKEMGGPVKVEFWGVDALHAVTTEPDRYKLDLPKGAKPGKAQAEAEAREDAANEELRQAREKDPFSAGGA